MKILALSNLYPPDFIGGYEIGCAQLVDALRARGHDVLVATAAPRLPVPGVAHVRRVFDLVDEWNPNGMGTEAIVQGLQCAESRLVNAHNIHVLTSLLEEFAPDVVLVSNIIGLGGLGVMACLQYLKIPWVWHLGDCVPRTLCSQYMVFDRVVSTLAEEFTRQIRGHYILVSQQLRDEVELSGITLRGEVEIIPYWITGERPAASPSPSPIGDGDGRLRIMSAGQVTREKGVDLLIEAAGLLRDSGHGNFALDVYGHVEGSYFDYLIRKRDLTGHVRLLGVRPHREILDLYRQYDVFAFPTMEREPFGLVPLEAAARGRVPIITRRCGIAEWLVHGVHCLKVDRTAEAFAGTFRSILEGEFDLEPIARRAESAAWRDFHIDAILPRIERTLAASARQSRDGRGTSADVYRMARLAEQLTQVLIQESFCA